MDENVKMLLEVGATFIFCIGLMSLVSWDQWLRKQLGRGILFAMAVYAWHLWENRKVRNDNIS